MKLTVAQVSRSIFLNIAISKLSPRCLVAERPPVLDQFLNSAQVGLGGILQPLELVALT